MTCIQPKAGACGRSRAKSLAILAAFMLAPLLAASPQQARAQQAEVLARYPGPTFLENLAVGVDGALYVTNYSGRTIEAVAPEGGAQTFATLDAHPVSLVADADGFTVVAHAVSFTEGDRFVGTGRLLRLDRSGAVLSDRPLDGVLFANGVLAEPGGYLIADSIGARIVRVNAATGAVSTFHEDPRLAPQTDPYFVPGANGLKRVGDDLIVSSSAGRALYRLPLDATGAPVGPLEPLAETLPGADDFAPLDEGGFVVATHGDSVVTIDATGAVTTLTRDPRVRGSTAVAVIGEGAARRLIVLGTGGFAEGAGEDAFVLAVPLPAQ